MSFRIPRRDIELRFVTKFGENRQLRRIGRCEVAEWSSGLPHEKLSLRGTRPSPHFAQNGPIAPKIPEHCHPLTCPRLPKLVRIRTLQNLFTSYASGSVVKNKQRENICNIRKVDHN